MNVRVQHIPTEQEEQIAFVGYLNARNIPFFHVPNSTWTKSWNQKRINHAMGVQPGVPDLFVFVNGSPIAIEMKRIKGATTSLAQKIWLEILNKSSVEARVCKGCEEAIAFVEEVQRRG